MLDLLGLMNHRLFRVSLLCFLKDNPNTAPQSTKWPVHTLHEYMLYLVQRKIINYTPALPLLCWHHKKKKKKTASNLLGKNGRRDLGKHTMAEKGKQYSVFVGWGGAL